MMPSDPKEALERLKTALEISDPEGRVAADLSWLIAEREGLERDAKFWEAKAIDNADQLYKANDRAEGLEREVERLKLALLKASANHEEFERKFYLEQDRAEAAESKLSALEDREALGRAIYLGLYGHQGARWEANDTKYVWYEAADRLRALLHPTVPVEREPIKAAYKQGWGDREDDLILAAARIAAPIKVDSVRALVAAVSAFLADEDEMMEKLLAEGKRLEDFGFPFPRVVEIRSALAALSVAPPSQGMETQGGWLPIVLAPTDGQWRYVRLPDGREVVASFDGDALGPRARRWRTKAFAYHNPSRPSGEKRGGVEQFTQPYDTFVIGDLPEGVYPTHFRPNDTVYGSAETQAA
jgi:hypothetical protein